MQDWANILYADESRFHMDCSDSRARFYHRVGERFTDLFVVQRLTFDGGNAIVLGDITARGQTPLVIIDGNLNGIRCHDEIQQ